MTSSSVPTRRKVPAATPLKKELEKINEKKDEAVYGGKFLEASILRDEINTLKEKLDYLEKQKNEKESKNSYVLGYDEIAAVISEMSKIPVSKLKQDESKKYINLNKDLKKEIIGQDVAVDVVALEFQRERGRKSVFRCGCCEAA